MGGDRAGLASHQGDVVVGPEDGQDVFAVARGGTQPGKGHYRAPTRPQWGRSIHVSRPYHSSYDPSVGGFPLGKGDYGGGGGSSSNLPCLMKNAGVLLPHKMVQNFISLNNVCTFSDLTCNLFHGRMHHGTEHYIIYIYIYIKVVY